MGIASRLETLPADLYALELQIEQAERSAVQREVALATASKEVGERTVGGVVDTYLVRVTDPLTLRSDQPVKGRDVWLVRYSGFEWYFPGPVSADGMASDGHWARHGYVFIDAATGEYLLTRWTE